MKTINAIKSTALVFTLLLSSLSYGADYKLDIRGQHAFINFKVQHLGYSWMLGQFRKFDGDFSYDKNKPNLTQININIDTTSVDSNHTLRDKHLKSPDFLNIKKYPSAKFVSSSYQENADNSGVLVGKLTFNGVTKDLTINTQKIGEGKDPWGGYRVGFSGTTKFKMKDFNVKKSLGPASTMVYLELNIEGVRQ